MTDELLLIDLSGIAHMIWHTDTNNPDPSRVSTQTIARVRALASEHPHAAVCCDSGRSFRADIDPTYKANRDTENRAPLRHQMDLACETLKGDGFVVWAVPGMEADDLIATAVHEATKIDGATVLIVSSDKDLLQLVSERVRVKSLVTGNISGPAEVLEKFKVRPDQIRDYLSLVGDSSDNIKGASNIGPKTAAELLTKFGDASSAFKAIFQKIPYGDAKEIYSKYAVAGDHEWKRIKKDLEPRVPVTPAVFLSLVEFYPRWPTVAQLIALRTDAPIELSEIASERVARPMVEDEPMSDSLAMMQENDDILRAEGTVTDAPIGRELTAPESALAAQSALQQAAERVRSTAQPNNGETFVCKTEPREPMMVTDGNRREIALVGMQASAPVDFSQQLEPRSIQEAKDLAVMAFASRNFSTYGTKEGILMTILAGRELGMKAMESLRNFHLIEGKPTMSADMIAGRVLSSGKARYFKPTGRSALAAAFKTLRIGEDEQPFELVYTIEEAKLAWKKDQRAWDASGWGKIPADMLVARCKSKLARLVYPDVCAGMYSVEEME